MFIVPLNDGEPDIQSYNEELAELGYPQWFDVAWLYSECYLYRRVNTLFSRSKSPFWKDYDVFARQKLSTFKSSRPAVLELAKHYRELVSKIKKEKAVLSDANSKEEEEAEKALFLEMCEICLWGNATDLSLLTSLSYEDIQKLQGSKARKESEKNILVNDLPKAFQTLRAAKARGKHPRVDIVLDNAGFELFVDLILAGYLLATGLASTIVLHPKAIPWFVSDVIPADFQMLLDLLAEPRTLYSSIEAGEKSAPLSDDEAADLRFLHDQWKGHYVNGTISLANPEHIRFWTHSGSYWRMPKTQPALFKDLQQSDLVIFKGDLNYRKLTGDAAWDPTTPFTTAIGPLGPGSGIRTLALRTSKADVIVGLPPGKDEELRETQGGEKECRKWAWSGKWAVVQYCDGKETS
ncbi:MAG: hypothetical protein Q9160_002390 [Pyrenula sp. 1 TL-2023]